MGQTGHPAHVDRAARATTEGVSDLSFARNPPQSQLLEGVWPHLAMEVSVESSTDRSHPESVRTTGPREGRIPESSAHDRGRDRPCYRRARHFRARRRAGDPVCGQVRWGRIPGQTGAARRRPRHTTIGTFHSAGGAQSPRRRFFSLCHRRPLAGPGTTLFRVARTSGGRAGYSGGSGTRNPEEVEHRFRRKWNSESGKWNTESGGSGTSIPEEVEQRFRRS